MVNINKDIIKKIKEIDVKADSVLKNAEIKAESIIVEKRNQSLINLNSAKKSREQKKNSIVESAKKTDEEKSKKLIEEELTKTSKIDQKKIDKLNLASDIVLELFIKKIENINSKKRSSNV